MNIFDVLEMLGGLCLFLFGMNIMGDGLERRAGNSLRALLSKITTNKFAGFFTGLGVTCIIQSSSATTVMVVGFVNSGLMTLKQAINVIIGANIGTTITGWVLSLSGISGESFIIKMLQPTSFTPILAVIGIIYYMFCKKQKKKDTGAILLGFATLMFGMDIMSGAFDGLKDSEAFQQLFIMFKNPLLGLLVGAVLTAIIQSSSASVGILQAVVLGGSLVPIGAAIPIIMGPALGTCVTAMLSCLGTKKDAKRAALALLGIDDKALQAGTGTGGAALVADMSLILLRSSIIPCEHIQSCLNEGRSYIVLSRERVTSCHIHFRTACRENFAQVSGLCLEVH